MPACTCQRTILVFNFLPSVIRIKRQCEIMTRRQHWWLSF